MDLWAIAFVASTTCGSVGVVVVSILWLRRVRSALVGTLGEAAVQQVRTAQRLNETIAALQRQEQTQDQQIRALIDTNIRMGLELSRIAGKVDTTEVEVCANQTTRTLH